MPFKTDEQRKAMFAKIKNSGIPSSILFPMGLSKVSMETSNKNYKLNLEKFGRQNSDNSQKGVRVYLKKDYNRHKAGAVGTVSSMTTYGGKPVDMTVYFDDKILSGDIPIEDIDILEPIDTPLRIKSLHPLTRGMDIVENGKRKTIPTSDPENDPRDKDANYDYEFMANTADVINSGRDAENFAVELTHSPKIVNFVDDAEQMLKKYGFWSNAGGRQHMMWRTSYRTKEAMSIGGLSSNKLYAPNGGVGVTIYPDKIQIYGHYSEAESSHAKVFKINETAKALSFLKKAITDINNVHHVSWI